MKLEIFLIMIIKFKKLHSLPENKYGKHSKKVNHQLKNKFNNYTWYNFISFIGGIPVIYFGSADGNDGRTWGYIKLRDLWD